MKTDTMPSYVKQSIVFDVTKLSPGTLVKVHHDVDLPYNGIILRSTHDIVLIATLTEQAPEDVGGWIVSEAFDLVQLCPADVALDSGEYNMEVLG